MSAEVEKQKRVANTVLDRLELESNTRLIAAAPELLEALLAIVGDKGVQRVSSDLLNQALAAIAKATGE